MKKNEGKKKLKSSHKKDHQKMHDVGKEAPMKDKKMMKPCARSR